jgi:Protein of unknown function (DUF3105)
VRRLLLVAIGALVVIAGIAALMLAFTSRDEPEVSSAAPGPGEQQPDLGARHLAADEHAPDAGLTDPPTSGPHHPDLVTRDRRVLEPDQIIHALELGNVVLFYDSARPPPELVAVQEEVSGPFDAEIAAAGQAVILARRSGAGPATALAWRRVLQTPDSADPRLRDFAEAWLGQRLGK